VAETEVAETAVYELRRGAGRSRGEIGPIEDRDRQAVPRRELGDSRPDDPAADDEQVELFVLEPPERPRALLGGPPRGRRPARGAARIRFRGS
jgi:hypothetical protein